MRAVQPGSFLLMRVAAAARVHALPCCFRFEGSQRTSEDPPFPCQVAERFTADPNCADAACLKGAFYSFMTWKIVSSSEICFTFSPRRKICTKIFRDFLVFTLCFLHEIYEFLDFSVACWMCSKTGVFIDK